MKNYKKFLALILILAMTLSIGGIALATQVTGTEDSTVTVTLDGKEVELKDANGSELDPVMINDSTYLPIRAIAEALGLEVNWDGTSNTVQLATSGNQAAVAKTDPIELTTVKGAVGNLVGYHDNGLYTFRGIPYATAERFQSPVPVTEYPNGTCIALSYGEVAPQDRTLSSTGSRNGFEFATPSSGTADMVGNETCQFLNVWSTNLTAKKPVIVFFHGGGLTNGASTELAYYTGEFLVQQQDVVFVSVNHRLNVLGYLDMSAYGDEFANSSIAGIEDCVVALRWVQDNIAQFGGDPSNVTIIGQSGGGTKVATLACMSDTVGLFDKVFFMSGALNTTDKATGLANTQKLVDYVMAQQGISEDKIAETLVNMDYEDLLAAATAARCSWNTSYDTGTFDSPLIDSEGNVNKYAAQRTWMIGTAFSEFNCNVIPLMSTGDPGYGIFNISDSAAKASLSERYGDKTQAIIDAFKKAYPTKPLAEALYMDNGVNYGVVDRPDLLNSTLSTLDAAGMKIYNYVTAYTSPYANGMTMHHTGDIPYWFYGISTIPYQIRGDEKNAYALADTMSSALAAFAASGNPSTSELRWKPWTADEHNTMVFDVKTELKVDFDTELYNLMFAE